MKKPKLKEFRFRFVSISVIVTLLILIAIQVLVYLHGKRHIELPEVVTRTFKSITLVVAILFFTSLLLRITIKRVYNFFEEPEERIFYSKIYSWTLYSIGIFIILHHFGVSLGTITIFIGLIATGLAFAVRDVLLSFFGWIILLRKKPFRIGDYIRIGESEGRVIHIGTFYVLLDKTIDIPEDFTRVPNRLFLEKSIDNLGKTTYHEELVFQLSDYPAEKNELLNDLFNNINNLLEIKDHTNTLIDLRNEKLVLIIRYLVSFEARQKARSEVIDLAFTKFQRYIVVPKP